MWRQYRYVFTADIAKMYRQILVDSRDITSALCDLLPANQSPITAFLPLLTAQPPLPT